MSGIPIYRQQLYTCFIDNKKAFNCAEHERIWIMLRDIGVPISSTGVAMILVGGGHPAMHQCCTRVKLSLAAGVWESCGPPAVSRVI